jgi:putative SOS response-associated peptidase YedK
MCGRFTLTRRDKHALAAELGVPSDGFADYKPRYNIAPLQDHFIVRTRYESREVLVARWGLVNHWSKDASQASKFINARAETVDTRPAFRDAFQRHRCVVPADGFFAWTGPKQARRPIWFHRADMGLILFAGLYESWQPAPGQWQRTFTIITCPPNAAAGRYHDRMPVILDGRAADDWMDPRNPNPRALKRLLVPAPEDLLVEQPVSPKLNSFENDSPDLLDTPAA